MSSLRDAMNSAEQARRVRETLCEKSKDGKHDWEQHGSWPSTWGKCKNCGQTYFDK